MPVPAAVPAALDLGPAPEGALASGGPVVALESSLVAHGLPWPRNLETVHAMCAAVAAGGAVPAVVGLVGGRIVVGMSDVDIERFARAGTAAKASRRDLPVLLAKGLDGATTVAATVYCAALAGISVLATGGIGGVHRDPGDSFDVSADILELARWPVAVVCSGAKSILDIGKTLEALETAGVTVIGYRTDSFPAFHVRDSGFRLDWRADTPAEAAEIVARQRQLPATGGVVIGNPVPASDALPADRVAHWLAQALAEARERDVRGKPVTPFLLRRLDALSEGATDRANRALLVANAACAAEIATALANRHRLPPSA